MKLGLINSAWVGSPVGTADGIHLTRELGFDSIDIFADPIEINAIERRLIRTTCAEEQLPVISTVCCALGIADFNASVRYFHVDRAKQYLEFCYELEGKNLLLVLGEYIWRREVIAPTDQWKWAVECTRELGDFAAALGLEIAIELEPFPESLVNDIPKMVRFLDDVDHSSVLANIDISHLHLSHTAPAEIAKLAGRIGHAHVSDCDGKKHGDLPPGRGVVPFAPYLEALAKTGFDGTMSIELEYSPEPEKIIEWVQEAYTETDNIMQTLGIRG